ncbi:hypothetical protein CHU98_g935 [Xylaria longipes]|nr:hypothetical protein CHU98_g935 [Xylaria longipes]
MSSYDSEGSSSKDTGAADATTQHDGYLVPFPPMLKWLHTTGTHETSGPGKPTVHRVPPPGSSGEEPEMARKTAREHITGAKSM